MATDVPRGGSRGRVRCYLERHGLIGGLHEFERSTKTAAEAAEAMGCALGQIVKSLVVIVDDRPLVALVAGDRRADLEAIRREAGGSCARMAGAEEVRAATGYAIGGVCPFDLPEELPVLIDESLARFDTVFPAAGTPSSMVELPLSRLRSLVGGRMARISH